MSGRPRRLVALVAVLLLTSVVLAGCTDEGGDSPPPPNSQGSGTGTGSDGPGSGSDGGTGAGTDAGLRVAGSRPVWFEGLEYVYDVSYPGQAAGGDLRIAVAEDDGSHWQMAVNATDDLLLWAFAWHLPVLGPVAKSDFAHPIHEVEVRLFDFPLEDGKSWTAPDHHGVDVTFNVSATTVDLFDGRNVKALKVVATRGGAPWITYTYTAEVGYFVTAEVDGDGDGLPDASMTLKGALVRTAIRAEPRFSSETLLAHFESGAPSIDPDAPALPPAPSPPNTGSPTFTVTEDHDKVYVVIYLGGGPGFYSAQVDFPSGDSRQYNLTQTEPEGGFLVTGYAGPMAAGTGEITAIPGGDGFVGVEIMGVLLTEA